MAAPARAVKYSSLPLVVLAATVALEAGERQSLAQAVEGLQQTFGVSDRVIGFLPAAMTLIAVPAAFPFGVLADKVRRTLLLSGAMFLWTISMFLNAIAPGYGALFATRMCVGAVEANSPATVSLLSDYYPVRNRARTMGLYQSGALVGAMVGLIGGGFAVAAGGWRWAFWMWVPLGALVGLAVARLPEPRRGDQDADFHDDGATALSVVDAGQIVERLHLPPPNRVGTLDYARATPREVYRELLRIPSMWFGVMALTVSGFLLNGLQFWGVEYFKRVHDLSAGAAGGFSALFGLGAAGGIITGGFIADSLLRRGVVNARVYIVSAASILATVLLVPGFLSTNLGVSGPLLVVGGVFLTMPIAPGEAMVNDVVVAQLRGRAATVRSVVRSLSAAGYVLIGFLSDAFTLRVAIAGVVPLYAIGGVLMLLAARSYPADLAFVGAEARRLREM